MVNSVSISKRMSLLVGFPEVAALIIKAAVLH